MCLCLLNSVVFDISRNTEIVYMHIRSESLRFGRHEWNSVVCDCLEKLISEICRRASEDWHNIYDNPSGFFVLTTGAMSVSPHDCFRVLWYYIRRLCPDCVSFEGHIVRSSKVTVFSVIVTNVLCKLRTGVHRLGEGGCFSHKLPCDMVGWRYIYIYMIDLHVFVLTSFF